MRQTLTVSGTVDPLLEITDVPDPIVGTDYSHQIVVSGGVPPYKYTPIEIPAGMTLSTAGLFSGKATAAGPWSFTVEDSGK